MGPGSKAGAAWCDCGEVTRPACAEWSEQGGRMQDEVAGAGRARSAKAHG